MKTNCGHCDYHTDINGPKRLTLCEYHEKWMPIDDTCNFFKPHRNDIGDPERRRIVSEIKNRDVQKESVRIQKENISVQKKGMCWNKRNVAIGAAILILTLILVLKACNYI